MILLLVILWSLCTIYFTHLLCEKKMKIAAIAVAVLDINIVFWTYLVFIIDVSGLGFKESRMAAVFGSDIFHSFVKLRDLSYFMPAGLHAATAVISIVVACAVILQVVISGIRLYKEIISFYRKGYANKTSFSHIVKEYKHSTLCVSKIYLLNCRLNN